MPNKYHHFFVLNSVKPAFNFLLNLSFIILLGFTIKTHHLDSDTDSETDNSVKSVKVLSEKAKGKRPIVIDDGEEHLSEKAKGKRPIVIDDSDEHSSKKPKTGLSAQDSDNDSDLNMLSHNIASKDDDSDIVAASHYVMGRERELIETDSGRLTPDYSSDSRESDNDFVKAKKLERKLLDAFIREEQGNTTEKSQESGWDLGSNDD